MRRLESLFCASLFLTPACIVTINDGDTDGMEESEEGNEASTSTSTETSSDTTEGDAGGDGDEDGTTTGEESGGDGDADAGGDGDSTAGDGDSTSGGDGDSTSGGDGDSTSGGDGDSTSGGDGDGGCNSGALGCECAPGDACLTGLSCIDGLCVEPNCGNGVVETGEECDDGSDNGVEGSSDCKSDCTENLCGDDYVGDTEACDDGNTVAHDGCNATCTATEPFCWDLTADGNEACPSGATRWCLESNTNDACTAEYAPIACEVCAGAPCPAGADIYHSFPIGGVNCLSIQYGTTGPADQYATYLTYGGTDNDACRRMTAPGYFNSPVVGYWCTQVSDG